MDNLNKKAMTQSERSSRYRNSKNIKRIVVDLKPEEYDMIGNYCKNNNIAKTRFIVKCCKYVIDNKIDI